MMVKLYHTIQNVSIWCGEQLFYNYMLCYRKSRKIYRTGLIRKPHIRKPALRAGGGGENMNIKVELQGLEEVNALLEENRRLTDELMDNISKLQRTCMHINARKKENQPEAATND